MDATRKNVGPGFARFILVVQLFLIGAPAALAHHSRAMFEMSRNVTYKGVVKAYQWENPHSHIVVTVGNDAQDQTTIGTWNIEASSTSIMRSQGWTPETFKPGDPITAIAHPTKQKGSKTILLFYVITKDGTKLYRAEHRYPLEDE